MRKSLSGFPFFNGRETQFMHSAALAERLGPNFHAVMAETSDARVAACVVSVAKGHSDPHYDRFDAIPSD